MATGPFKVALAISATKLLRLRPRTHHRVARSWLLLAPMSGAPLVGGLMCFLGASVLPRKAVRRASL